jgi:hypothetical protein
VQSGGHINDDADKGQARLATALAQHKEELAAYRQASDPLGEALALNNLEHQGRWREAIPTSNNFKTTLPTSANSENP